MALQDSIQVTYSSEGDGSECSKKYGISTNLTLTGLSSYSQKIYLWTKTQEEGSKYSLYYSDDALGLGTNDTATSEEIETYITFSFDSSPDNITVDNTELIFGEEADVSFAQETLTYPAESIVSVTAESAIISISSSGQMTTLYSKDERIPVEDFELSPSGLCVTPSFQSSNISGTVKLVYQRVSNRKYWEVYDLLNLGVNKFYLFREGVFQEEITITMSVPTEDEETTDRTIQLLVVDHSELTPIASAYVYFDGNLKGQTDENGYITVETTAGSHNLLITASGYLDTNEDELSNDTIVID